MAHLWIADPAGGGWCVLPLEPVPHSLVTSPPRPAGDSPAADADPRDVRLVPAGGPEGTAWTLIAGSARSVGVCGRPLPLGIRVLSDRDEIRIEGVGTMFFATETLARVEPFPHADREFFCARCKIRLEPLVPSVRCPACGVWHHQAEPRACWTYAPACAMCAQPTDLDAGFRWAPDDA
jgi:hypothetical protein